jgi:hypothetical protein
VQISSIREFTELLLFGDAISMPCMTDEETYPTIFETIKPHLVELFGIDLINEIARKYENRSFVRHPYPHIEIP